MKSCQRAYVTKLIFHLLCILLLVLAVVAPVSFMVSTYSSCDVLDQVAESCCITFGGLSLTYVCTAWCLSPQLHKDERYIPQDKKRKSLWQSSGTCFGCGLFFLLVGIFATRGFLQDYEFLDTGACCSYGLGMALPAVGCIATVCGIYNTVWKTEGKHISFRPYEEVPELSVEPDELTHVCRVLDDCVEAAAGISVDRSISVNVLSHIVEPRKVHLLPSRKKRPRNLYTVPDYTRKQYLKKMKVRRENMFRFSEEIMSLDRKSSAFHEKLEKDSQILCGAVSPDNSSKESVSEIPPEHDGPKYREPAFHPVLEPRDLIRARPAHDSSYERWKRDPNGANAQIWSRHSTFPSRNGLRGVKYADSSDSSSETRRSAAQMSSSGKVAEHGKPNRMQDASA